MKYNKTGKTYCLILNIGANSIIGTTGIEVFVYDADETGNSGK
jgi:hypothetical protein